MYEWVKGNAYTMIVTINPTNITLNSVAAAYFDDIRWCCIGLDEKEKKVAIKPVTKREVDLKLLPLDTLNKVSLGKGYARITNKSIINDISKIINGDCDGIKFHAHFDESNKLLEIDLNDGE